MSQAAALSSPASLPGAGAPAAEQVDSERLPTRPRALPAAPLLLLVHGRSGGHIPAELRELAADLEQRRGALVQLLALTDPQPPCLPAVASRAPATTLVPLLLLPGSHVRHDLPALATALKRQGPLRRVPFLGSWPVWQRALAAELKALAASADPGQMPLLLHHPLQGRLAERYLDLLARRCGASCRPAAFEPVEAGSPPAGLPRGRACLPLALAANRFTDNLQALPGCGEARPLLARPHLRRVLLGALAELP